MRIERLELTNFRGFSSLDINFGDAPIAALAGVNGAGKSSVLDSLAILLTRLFARIRSSTAAGRALSPKDINNYSKFTVCRISLRSGAVQINWGISKGRPMIIGNSDVTDEAARIRRAVEADARYNIPLAVYYPVNRAVFDIPLRVRKKEDFSQTEAYDQALSGARNDFRSFFQWFRVREDYENEEKAHAANRRRYVDKQLDAVRRAVSTLLPGFSNLHVRRSPLRMLIEKEGAELNINQLSDGEKCMLALVGDLARRLAIANPSLKNPLEGEAIVLIDEIELHLHPAWQRMAVSRLPIVFPNAQFIVTTHSAPVLSEIKSGGVILLSGGKVFEPESYGHDVNSILEDIMGTTVRPQSVEGELSQLFDFIDRGEIDSARKLKTRLAEELGAEDADLARAGFMIRRKEEREVASNH